MKSWKFDLESRRALCFRASVTWVVNPEQTEVRCYGQSGVMDKINKQHSRQATAAAIKQNRIAQLIINTCSNLAQVSAQKNESKYSVWKKNSSATRWRFFRCKTFCYLISFTLRYIFPSFVFTVFVSVFMRHFFLLRLILIRWQPRPHTTLSATCLSQLKSLN